MSPSSSRATGSPASGERLAAEARAIAELAAHASVEMTWHDSGIVARCRSNLAAGTRVYVSFVPGQSWRDTLAACAAVRDCGLEPVPHLPAREIGSAAELDSILAGLSSSAGVRSVLVIAGDRAAPAGPFAGSLDIMKNGALERHGIREISVAAHPEGHPRIAAAELHRVEQEKADLAARSGIGLTFLTQFFFEAEPFVAWARELRDRGVKAKIVAGLAGPARIATLFRYAARCGAGASIRALGTRPSSIASLVGERGPERMVRALAAAAQEIDLAGIHLYSFGGLERTCAWVEGAARRRLALDNDGSFRIAAP